MRITLIENFRAVFYAPYYAALAQAVAGYFPGIPPATLSACCRDDLALGLWNRDPVVQREGLLWLRDAALGTDLIRKRYSYEDCVDMRFADEVVAEDPPALPEG
ncbi:MAG: hypothetical protein HYY78_13640 [Betaproteobacteria bacterium]|nr:hypothetical protein [Betaproteobacteria bacterium]